MIHQPNTSATTPNKKDGLSKLNDVADFPRWKSQLQDIMFDTKGLRSTNMDTITEASTLSTEYFAAHSDFKADYKLAAKDDDSKTCNPFDHRPESDFTHRCFAHALDKGHGFEDWLYPIYAKIRRSLCNKIQDQTQAVRRGDIVSLIRAIKIALHQYEMFSVDQIEVSYASCTMEKEGRNDLMMFLSVLATTFSGLRPFSTLPLSLARCAFSSVA